LREGDVIKFGRYQATVAQLCLSGEAQVPRLSALEGCDEDVIVPSSVPESPAKLQRSDSIPRCRICLGDALDESADVEEDPMIQAPCHCKGSNGRMHISCLSSWLATKCGLDDLRQDGQFYSFNPPCCEVCKAEFPVAVTINKGLGKEEVSLLPLSPIAPPFMVLSLPKSDARPYGERFVFAPSQDGTELTIGRSRDAQLYIKDVSVSRVHATVTLDNGAFVLKNNAAKFQTCIQPALSKIRLPPIEGREQNQSDAASKVQLGRTVLDMKLHPPLRWHRGKREASLHV